MQLYSYEDSLGASKKHDTNETGARRGAMGGVRDTPRVVIDILHPLH